MGTPETRVESVEKAEIGRPGTEELTPGVSVSLLLSDVDTLLAAYNPASSTSPPVADCRPVLRAILDAIIASETE